MNRTAFKMKNHEGRQLRVYVKGGVNSSVIRQLTTSGMFC